MCCYPLVVRYPDGAFFMPAGNLVFSVTVFTCCSLVAFAVLHIQRVYAAGGADQGGELGGPRRKMVAFFFVLMWLLYIILSSLKSEGIIS